MLTKTERRILSRLTFGESNKRILTHFPRMTLSTLHVHCMNIRRKTGIADLRNPDACRRYQRNMEKPAYPKPPLLPSPKQLEIMKLLAEGKSWNEIVCITHTGWQTAQNHASKGCKRAGIIGAGHGRTEAIKQWLARGQKPAAPEEDPMF